MLDEAERKRAEQLLENTILVIQGKVPDEFVATFGDIEWLAKTVIALDNKLKNVKPEIKEVAVVHRHSEPFKTHAYTVQINFEWFSITICNRCHLVVDSKKLNTNAR